MAFCRSGQLMCMMLEYVFLKYVPSPYGGLNKPFTFFLLAAFVDLVSECFYILIDLPHAMLNLLSEYHKPAERTCVFWRMKTHCPIRCLATTYDSKLM